jgi:hypothetical protein
MLEVVPGQLVRAEGRNPQLAGNRPALGRVKIG